MMKKTTGTLHCVYLAAVIFAICATCLLHQLAYAEEIIAIHRLKISHLETALG